MTQPSSEEQLQAIADQNLGMQLAQEERDTAERAALQKRASEIAANVAEERRKRAAEALEAKTASSDAAMEQFADEAAEEAEGGFITPGDNVAKAAAAGQSAEAEVEAESEESAEERSKGDEDVKSASKNDAKLTVEREGPDQGDPGDRDDKSKPSKRSTK